MNRICILGVLLAMLICQNCKSTKKLEEPKTLRQTIGFYNVENLFDTQDDPLTLDEEFTPEGKNKWTEDRCQNKLEKISQVIEALEYPFLFGLCEVENEAVLEQLCSSKELKKNNYGHIHYDSPDKRGIDVALLYRKGIFKPMRHYPIRVNIPDDIEADYTTRDILYVKGELRKKYLLHIFVNHWPSRRGGVQESEPKRTFTAQRLRKSVDSLYNINSSANIVILGDFNDEPNNTSLNKTLKADAAPMDTIPTGLVNTAMKLYQQDQGTYKYRGDWNMLDQIIISQALYQKAGSDIHQKILSEDWLIYEDEKYGKRPNRTYGGPVYYGGYSDHLPVYLELKLN